MKKAFNPSEWLGKKKSSLSTNPVIPNTEKGGSPEPPVSSSPECSKYSEFSDLEAEIEQLDGMIDQLEAAWNGKQASLECNEMVTDDELDTSGEDDGSFDDNGL